MQEMKLNTRSTMKGTPFGVGLAKARVAAGLSQQEVANIVGRAQTNISSWEVGRSEPDLTTLCKLLDLYCVPFEDIVNYTPHPASISEEEMQLVLKFRSLSKQNKEAVEAVIAIYSKYQ